MVSESGKMISESLTCYKQHLHDNYCRKKGEIVSYKLEQLKIVKAIMNGYTTADSISVRLQKNLITVRSQVSTLVTNGVLIRKTVEYIHNNNGNLKRNGEFEINYPVFIDWFMAQINLMEGYAEAITTQRDLMEMSV